MDEPFAARRDHQGHDAHHLLDVWERNHKTVLFVTHSIPEAVMLSDRVLVLGSRPGRVTAEVNVGLERPRTEAMEDSAEFAAAVREIRDALREGWH